MNQVDKFEMGIVRFAIGFVLSGILLTGLAISAVACPKGTHPVCTYDPVEHRSHCVCVPGVVDCK